jgi:hypothetical protein
MTLTESSLQHSLRGLPFLSDEFDHRLVVTAVGTKRMNSLTAEGTNPQRFLTSQCGVRYHTTERNHELQRRWETIPELSTDQMVEVDRIRAAVATQLPVWQPLLDIPIRFVTTDDPAVMNASNPYVPQTIALGERAFDSDDDLAAALIHEYAHVWLGLLCEIEDIDNGSDTTPFTLPSGTAGKSLRTVVFAAHFAAVCGAFLSPEAPCLPGSSVTYAEYAREAVASCANSPGLTVMGHYVWAELDRFLTRAA